VLAGLAVGGIASYFGERYIEPLLFGTSPGDPLTFAAIALIHTDVAPLAGYLSARRASGIDPMVTLRN
jgi:putative ABC transport system permease protein